ncbi:MAG: VOC family protein [Ignavibacteriales bacterium]|nr:VOC family protein [Ignavibacteriales bacterium]MBK7981199.1 VOC family protein [Ignavibacteriota bacterium]
MKNIHPYINCKGNTEEAFNFYKSVFGGDFLGVTKFKDIPGENQIPENLKDKIMHISLPLCNGIILMGTDAIEEMGHKLNFGNNMHIMITTDSKEEADELFNKLSVGGKIEMPMSDQFWGDYFGNFTDKFGINWMIDFSKQI